MILYIRNEFHAKIIDNINVMRPELEKLFVEFSIRAKTNIVGNIYRPPGGCLEQFLSTLEDILSEVVNKYGTSKAFILRDFNRDLITLNRNKMCSIYFTMMSSFGYRPTIFRPTKVTATSLTMIDQTWTNDYENVKASEILLCSPSDDFPLIVSNKSGRTALDHSFIVGKVRRNNVTIHNENLHLISSGPRLDLSSSKNVQYILDKLSEKLINVPYIPD